MSTGSVIAQAEEQLRDGLESAAARVPGQLGRASLTAVALAYGGAFLVLPLVVVFAMAFSKGFEAFLTAIQDPDAVAAIKLTLTIAAIAVPLNLVFGVCAA